MNIDNPLTSYRINQIFEALHGRALTVDEIAPIIGVCRTQASRYLAALHDAGAVYVAAWPTRQSGRATRIAAYRLGKCKDAARPPKLSGQQRQAAFKARLRADVDLYERHKAVSRNRKRPVMRDPLVAAMFGPGAAAEVQHGAH